MRLRTLLVVVSMLLAPAGCTSITSTMLTRDEGNRSWTRNGGLKGVPITLRVPTHVQLTIYETHHLVKNEDQTIRRLKLPFVIRDFSQEFIYSEKIFTVDFKRPAAGLYNMHLDLTDDQYIKQLQLDITDQTIQQVKALVDNIIPSGAFTPASDKQGTDVPVVLFQDIQSVVAVDIFEMDAPDFEEQMMHFINVHLNQAHDSRVAPPDVKALHRTSLIPDCAVKGEAVLGKDRPLAEPEKPGTATPKSATPQPPKPKVSRSVVQPPRNTANTRQILDRSPIGH